VRRERERVGGSDGARRERPANVNGIKIGMK
jgi:hypothetical protein